MPLVLTPFSLQEQKVYVQHIIPQHACHLAAAVSSGACIIVCGAAQQMPKAVFAAIVEALSAGSNMSIEDAEEVLKGIHVAVCRRTKHAAHSHSAPGMERSQRYLLDTWS